MSVFGSYSIKSKHFRVKHQKVKLFRANEPLLSVFMWGINHTINELQHVSCPSLLMPDDFKSYSKIKADNHLFNKENMPSHYKVKEYCPLVFRNLRERFGIDDIDYLYSITKSQPTVTDAPGRSGAKFYQSHDQLFIIKTLISEEVEQMHSLLKQYHPYIVQRHGKTLLPQYLGMYRITVEGVESYLVVMRNVFSNHLPVHRKYDLKGSTVDREASDKERNKDLPTLKDNDFVKDGCKVYIGDKAKNKLLETLTADVDFLSSLNLMDYSLLVGIHDCAKGEVERQQEQSSKEASVAEEASNKEAAAEKESSENGVEGSCLGGAGEAAATTVNEEEEGSECGLTPPDSPTFGRPESVGEIDPRIDIYAMPSTENSPTKEIYFMGIIDVLTIFGFRKRTAQAAKQVKHGAGAEISTVHPDQYAKRFLEFMTKAIE